MSTTDEPDDAGAARSSRAFTVFRLALGIVGLVATTWIVRRVGVEIVLGTLREALPWLPALAAIELARIGCSALASYFAFGALAPRIPRGTLLRAHVIGHGLATVAPAPTVVNESVKATFFAPYTGAPAAAAVGFINQSATLISVGLLSIPCGVAIYLVEGASLWFLAAAVHAVVLVGAGLGLGIVTRARRLGALLVGRFPKLEERAAAFREHADTVDLAASKPTTALFVGRCLQMAQYALAARAVGIDMTILRALSAQGVSLVANAVGALVPGGFGTTEGAFTLAADLLGTTAARATALALLMRSTQLVWLAIASAFALVDLRRPRS